VKKRELRTLGREKRKKEEVASTKTIVPTEVKLKKRGEKECLKKTFSVNVNVPGRPPGGLFYCRLQAQGVSRGGVRGLTLIFLCPGEHSVVHISSGC